MSADLPMEYHQFGNRYHEMRTAHARVPRVVVWAPETFQQLLDLPLGTELGLFKVVMPIGIMGSLLVVTEEFRAQTRAHMEAGTDFDFDFSFYLLPDDVVPDTVPDPEQTGD